MLLTFILRAVCLDQECGIPTVVPVCLATFNQRVPACCLQSKRVTIFTHRFGLCLSGPQQKKVAVNGPRHTVSTVASKLSERLRATCPCSFSCQVDPRVPAFLQPACRAAISDIR